MPNTTNFNWTTPADTDLVKNGALAIRTLANGIDTSLVDLKGGTTGQVLAKATNTDLDFSWVAQDDSNAIQNSIIDAKGDLIVGSAADTPARLAAGTNGYLLSANSAATNGLEWIAAPSSGGMTLISETIASANSSISFSSLGSYKQLMLIWHGIRHSDANSAFSLRFNASSSSTYNIQGLQTSATALLTTAGALTGVNGYNTTTLYTFGAGTNNAAVGTDSMGYVLIDNYTSSTKFKNYVANFAYYDANGNAYRSVNGIGFFEDTTAITSLDITRLVGTGTISNTANTTIRLYGIS